MAAGTVEAARASALDPCLPLPDRARVLEPASLLRARRWRDRRRVADAITRAWAAGTELALEREQPVADGGTTHSRGEGSRVPQAAGGRGRPRRHPEPECGRWTVATSAPRSGGSVFTLLLGGLIVAGSRSLAHFDAALVGYTFATSFATFGITYRYVMWFGASTDAGYRRRGWGAFFSRASLGRTPLLVGLKRAIVDVAGNRFIFRRCLR